MMRRKTAAEYVDLSESAFEREVLAGRLPSPVMLGGREHWDVRALDEAADLIETDGKRIAELEPVVRELAEMPFGGEVWERSKWLADLTKRARELLKVRA